MESEAIMRMLVSKCIPNTINSLDERQKMKLSLKMLKVGCLGETNNFSKIVTKICEFYDFYFFYFRKLIKVGITNKNGINHEHKKNFVRSSR